MSHRPTLVALLVVAVLAAPAVAASPDDVRACSEAVRAMIRANADIRTGLPGVSGRSVVGGETIAWDSVSGHQGVCRIDAQGRLYGIEIARFPASIPPGGGSSSPYYVSCSSDDNRYRECSLHTPGKVELARRESRADCLEGRSWGYSPRSVWVDAGCRGIFRVTPYGGGGGDGWPDNAAELARASCLERARREGVRVTRVTRTDDRGSVVDVGLLALYGGISTEMTCRYDKRTGTSYWIGR